MDVKTMYCNNCGGRGHIFKTCKDPITSCGIILLRDVFEPMKLPVDPRTVSVLMVLRKDSMSYMEFIRGKYEVSDIDFVKRLISNMTIDEQKAIVTENFDTLWTKLWGQGRDTHSMEYDTAKTNYESLNRNEIVSQVPSKYKEPEWGFPKGRRIKGESDVTCGIREFWEETNILGDAYEVIERLKFTETFVGTNDVKYKHIYFIAVLKDSKLINLNQKLTSVQKREIGAVGWKTLKECKEIIRPHYPERKQMISEIERVIETFQSI